jgi:hypothetical protein
VKAMCSVCSAALDTVGPSVISGPLASHADRCDSCGRAVRHARELPHALATLPTDAETAPAHLHPSVMASLGPVLVEEPERRGSRLVPVAAAVVAAAAAGTVVILRLHRTRAA